MQDRKNKKTPKTIEREEYFNNRDYRRRMMNKKKKSSKRKFSLLAIAMLVIVGFGIAFSAFLFQGLPPLSSLENPKTDLATKIYSEDGELIDQFFIENRTIVSLDAIPKDLINALIATEDRKFFKHWGIDLDRIMKAMFKNITSLSIKEGASTITQQLARNLYRAEIGRAISITRKLKEAITAVQIEKTYTKDEILLLYLNQVYFGRGAYGVEAAAKTFFDKSVTELTLDECAMLVGMVKNPSGYYDPIENPENCLDRRNTVLNNMHEESYITKEVLDLAKNDPIKAQPRTIQKQSMGLGGQFSEYVRQLLEKKAEKYGFNIYRDGLIVTTSLNSKMQKHAVDAVTNQLKDFQKSFNSTWNWKGNRDLLNDAVDKYIKQSDEYKKAKTDTDRQKIYNKLKQDQAFVEKVKEREIAVQVGFVCIDPKTGQIKALVGQNPAFPFKYGLNHVTQIKRQPGSSFKAFVYATAIDNGYSPAYAISNDPLRVVIGGQTWSPKGGGTGGMVSLREGITRSINVVAVRTSMELAPMDQVIKLAHKMGINSELPNVLSLALGVGEVSPLEMTSAFGVFPNEGIWVEPHAILKIEDRYGNVIEEVIPETREAISEGVAYMMSDMMEDVVNDGTASSIRGYFNRPAAGKTGTTQDYTDAWFVGFTPQLVAGCWLGFDDPRIKFGGSYGQGGRAAAPIWGRFMKYVYDDNETTMPLAYFEMPPEVMEANICTVTGLLGNESCPSYTDLILRKNAQKRCSMSHSFAPSEGAETNGDPPAGSIGF
ncbi:MAG: PBP1A family penicillin-binding protein [Ignavibacteria bacterium]|nr:PBP1A family penicillin-binding protein [Ignavibacteria bacterium]MCC7159253.1 PBP1A family penicillin-binding protein [Ignavibacteria bacterium]